jgi:3-oxoacyl-[acyl-carrier protein] reductase
MARTPDYFKDKAIIITGAGSGIGRAAALIFAREGAKVLCADLDEANARGTADAITAAGGKALSIRTDVTQRAQVQEMADNGMEAFGRIHFLFNSAGSAMRRSKFLDIDDDLFDRTFDLNVKGTFYGMQAILPHMLEHGGGVIVNVSSMAHKRGGPGTSVHYAASKGAVNTMTMGVAREFADRGIRCMAVAPAAVNTAFQSSSNTSPEMMQRVLADLPMKRLGEPDEVGELVLFLCSDACQFMTADTVYVSGGGGWR